MEQYTAWANVPANLKTKTQLAKEGLKPAKDQKPVAEFCSFIRGKRRPTYYDLYDAARAVPKRKATEAQLAALQKAQVERNRRRTCERCGETSSQPLRHFPHCRRCKDHLEMVAWAREVLADPGTIILDTETTDLYGQPVEIAVIDISGRILLDTLVQATEPISEEARAIHGITDEMLLGQPTFPEIYPELCRILEASSRIVIYNADFDFGVLERARRIHKLPHYPVAEFWEGETERPYRWRGLNCAMEAYAQYYGSWSHYHNSYRWIPLSGGHRALGDCLACLERVKGMAKDDND